MKLLSPKSTSINIFMGIFLLMAITSCSSKRGPGKACDCSASITIENQTLLEANELPKDLTCVVAINRTHSNLIDQIVSLYNTLHGTQVHLEQNGEQWKDLDAEITDWLGGAYVGDCGNLFSGLTFDYKRLGEKVDINIKATKTEILRDNGLRKTAPFWYQANVTFSVKMTDKEGNVEEGHQESGDIVVGSCNRYSAVL